MEKLTLKHIKNLNWRLILNVTLIFIFGLVMLTTATHANRTGNYREIMKQLLAFGIGVALIIFTIKIDYIKIGKFYNVFYIFTIILLLVIWVPGLGVVQEGSRRWIKLGPLYLQTSEIAKLTFIISYAKIAEGYKGKLNTIKQIIPAVLKAMPVLFLMLMQPDLGGTIVFICIMFGMLFVSGLNGKIIRNTILIGVLLLPLIYTCLAPHQKVRIEAFLNPNDLSYKGNYQVVQSMIAIGSGGVKGKGLYEGTQSQNGFLPVPDSDFIFAVIGEELGLIGLGALVLLYGAFLLTMIKDAEESKDFYGTLIIIGVTSMFAYQIIQNIGMTMALIPVTGITLPFISYGASSLVGSLAALGLVLNVGMRKRKINF